MEAMKTEIAMGHCIKLDTETVEVCEKNDRYTELDIADTERSKKKVRAKKIMEKEFIVLFS